MFNRRRLLTTALAFKGLAGCTAQSPAPTAVALSITGGADMNGGAPAEVKVYYLADASAFRAADFFAVFETPEATLGDDLLSLSQFGLAPGRIVTDSQSFASPPAAIGVVAAFRDINGAFLATHPLVPNAPNPVQVTLTGNRVVIR